MRTTSLVRLIGTLSTPSMRASVMSTLPETFAGDLAGGVLDHRIEVPVRLGLRPHVGVDPVVDGGIGLGVGHLRLAADGEHAGVERVAELAADLVDAGVVDGDADGADEREQRQSQTSGRCCRGDPSRNG